ncbi:aldehyde dehydrogenase family protein [Photobacterium sp. WH24]|uniref:aldehyde dehydrogenase family protein n=1 Tax=Photobacterium sp. WH24 TaxID=2827237 RepID=UPI001C452D43|nr:aldehyde dehydrogenase family protein [Photobacterium sp. WH24]MBV7261696.1 aldehyde dehydrogenase family protein [Photobacterium sp. WH24]
MKWYEIEAQKIHSNVPSDKEINISAGFGPTGLPHIGTLCEIIRTNFLKKSLEKLGRKVHFHLISDDLDPFRKIPLNLPNQGLLKEFLGKSINQVPDPFQMKNSFSEMVEDKLVEHINRYNIDCNLVQNSISYQSGEYNAEILNFLHNYEVVNNICKESVGPLRNRTYSIFMPISPTSGRVIEHINLIDIDSDTGEITYIIPADEIINKPGSEYGIELKDFYSTEILNEPITTSVLDGNCKLQWKADWAMRLLARDIRFEMHGEDLTSSANIAIKIATSLEREAPRLYKYGLFLDDNYKKISKSKGNGFSLEKSMDLLTDKALINYLEKKPKRNSKFHVNLSPRLNDLALTKNELSVSYTKAQRILSASQPHNLQSAIEFLRRYSFSMSNEAIKYSYNYFLETKSTSKSPKLKLSEKEKKFVGLLSFCLEEISAEKTQDINLYLTVHDCYKNTFDKHSKEHPWEIIYKSLFNNNYGPRLSTWLEISGYNEFIRRLKDSVEMSETTFIKELDLDKASSDEETKIASKLTYTTEYIRPNYLEAISFDLVKEKCLKLALALKNKRDEIIQSVSSYQCRNVTDDEISRSLDLLLNIQENQEYFKLKVQGVTSFLPLNQPIYATVCFGFIPSLMSKDTCIRPPTAMHSHYQKLIKAIDFTYFSNSLSISFEDKESFISKRIQVTDAVIFTGTPENALKVRKHFRKKTLFILNGAGHNPLVISKDANIDQAVESAMRVVLYNQGQDCAGPNSILIHQDSYSIFRQKLVNELEKIKNKVGLYDDPDNIVGPNSDVDHSIKLATIFKQYREYCTYGGEINIINGLIRPTIFEKPLSLGGNYKEFFAPIFFLQEYRCDEELESYFFQPQYSKNAMYISLFGSSDYINNEINENIHLKDSILINTDLHLVERGTTPYGGQGIAASCIYFNGEVIKGNTLPQRDIYNHLVLNT